MLGKNLIDYNYIMVILNIIGGLILGLISGMCVNYLCDVLPFYRRLTSPICYQCHQPQSWSDFIFLRVCTHCHVQKSWRHKITYLVYLIFCLSMALYPPSRLGLMVGVILLIFFGTVAIIDFEYRVVLDQVSLAGIILGLICGIWLHGLWPTIIGGAAGFGIMLLFYYTGIWYSRWMARRRGQATDAEVALGFGDVNLSGILGMILGWPGIVAGLLLAIILGGIASLFLIILLLIRKKWQPSLAIPYAPFLVIGAGILLYFR
jgi:prepilin signal peptidase PulO-like enzyme (type II secretory pathway)